MTTEMMWLAAGLCGLAALDATTAERAATIVVAVATVVLAVLTGMYVWLTHALLRAQTDPHVVVYARDDRDRPTIIEIVIENVGRTVAQDVRFEVSQPLVRAYGVSPKDPPSETRPLDTGPLVSGIPALGPGGTRRLLWGQFGGLRHLLGDGTVTVTARFKRGTRELPPVVCLLDVRSFDATDASTSPPVRLVEEMHRLTAAIERLERGVSKWPPPGPSHPQPMTTPPPASG